MTRKSFVTALASGAALVALAAVGTTRAQVAAPHGEMMAGGGVSKAVAVLHATKKGGEAHGKVTFTRTPQGVKVEAHIHGLTPGPHGFHIHEFGDCSSDDAMSAGGHFNPTAMPHAAPTAGRRHVGDLGNIEADASGHATLELVDPALMFAGPTSIIGRGLIVHAKADDLKSQPAGAAGDRVACGVIGVARPPGMPEPAKK
jgi:Cu-Zn family superoxide dismutase